MASGSRMARWWPSTSRSAIASSLGSTPALKRRWLALSTSSCARTTFAAFWIREKKYGGPTITKDGVTVAKEIELKDPLENMGAQMVREVASKTSDVAGDG